MTLDPWKRRAAMQYVQAMMDQLERDENASKGGWEEMSSAELMNEVWYHAAKLLKAIDTVEDRVLNVNAHGEHGIREARLALLEFAADVGNCAMMVAETTDSLELVGDPEVGENGEKTVEWQTRSYP